MVTRRELNLMIFTGEAEQVLWQPRLETWIHHHRRAGTLPARFLGLDDLEIYDALGCSVRYAASAGIEEVNRGDVEQATEVCGDREHVRLVTPRGDLVTTYRLVRREGEVVNRRISDFPVRSAADLRILTWFMGQRDYRADPGAFRGAERRVGERAEPTVFLNSSGFTDLIKFWAGLENTYYLLHDHPDAFAAYIRACEERDDRQLEAALELPARIFNLGDHATDEFTPPPILEQYLLGRWQRISERLHAGGRYVHSHWDGNARTILPYLGDSGLDGVEALTPEPMGNITLEEIRDAVNARMVCLDLLPAIHFLPRYPLREVLDFARRAIDTFAPRLILGVSDEISEAGEIGKIEAIGELVDRICGLAE